MEIVRCSKGHFYDSEENATCPMCAAEAARNKNPIGNNVLPDGIIGTSYFDDGNTPSPTLPSPAATAIWVPTRRRSLFPP